MRASYTALQVGLGCYADPPKHRWEHADNTMKTPQTITAVAIVIALVGCSRRQESKPTEQSPRERLIAKLAAQTDIETLRPQSGTPDDFRRFAQEQRKNPQPCPVVSLEDFFEGNHDEGSIGCNVIPFPGLEQFCAVLKSIRSKENVQDVLVAIYSLEGDESWPFSESIWILAEASDGEVLDWMRPLKPTEIWKGWGEAGKPAAAPDPADGIVVYGLWWD